MRKLTAAVLVAGVTAMAGPVLAADLPYYPPVIDIPDVDYGYSGSFYLRGSAGLNALWAKEANAYECVAPCGGLVVTQFPFVSMGYGYSVGAGFGFETGTGLRFDATLDYLGNEGLKVTKGPAYGARAGDYTVKLRSTLALANVYYDFSLGGSGYGYGAAGGAFGYVGARRRGRALRRQHQRRRGGHGRRGLRFRRPRRRCRLSRHLHQPAQQQRPGSGSCLVRPQLRARSARHPALSLQLTRKGADRHIRCRPTFASRRPRGAGFFAARIHAAGSSRNGSPERKQRLLRSLPLAGGCLHRVLRAVPQGKSVRWTDLRREGHQRYARMAGRRWGFRTVNGAGPRSADPDAVSVNTRNALDAGAPPEAKPRHEERRTPCIFSSSVRPAWSAAS